jgi:hypothetical protein
VLSEWEQRVGNKVCFFILYPISLSGRHTHEDTHEELCIGSVFISNVFSFCVSFLFFFFGGTGV